MLKPKRMRYSSRSGLSVEFEAEQRFELSEKNIRKLGAFLDALPNKEVLQREFSKDDINVLMRYFVLVHDHYLISQYSHLEVNVTRKMELVVLDMGNWLNRIEGNDLRAIIQRFTGRKIQREEDLPEIDQHFMSMIRSDNKRFLSNELCLAIPFSFYEDKNIPVLDETKQAVNAAFGEQNWDRLRNRGREIRTINEETYQREGKYIFELYD